jgi:adenine-specific DNA-methyltransferase
VNQAIALKHDRAACLTQHKTEKNREILDGRHINRYVTGQSPNYFKFDISKIHSCKREDIFLLPEKLFFRRVSINIRGKPLVRGFLRLVTVSSDKRTSRK